MPLSFTDKRWISSEQRYVPLAFTELLMEQRGLAFAPPLSTQPDFRAGKRVIERIKNAIECHERIGIFGDYDCDGITSCALMSRFFQRKGICPVIRLPLRTEGYGLSLEHVDAFRAERVSLLLTLDTGITASHPIAYANIHGIDVIIIDHHHLPVSLPSAYAMIHPLLADPPIHPPLAAAGLTYILIRLLEEKKWNDHPTDLALASLGTIADLAELKGLNRTIAQEGLFAWNNLPDGALKDIKTSAGILGPLSSTDISFRIAPRINAAGRMGDPSIALTALLYGGEAIALLEDLNNQRCTCVEKISTTLPDISLSPFICLADETYHPGIIGLLAAKLTERFNRPSLVAHILNGICTASLRSIPTFNVVNALETSRELLINFGGHAQAAGCTFEYKNFFLLQNKLSSALSQSVSPSDLIPTLSIDAEIALNDITMASCEDLQRLEPFGQGNPEPRFLIRGVHAFNGRYIGNNQKHLQVRIGHTNAVGFGLGKFLPKISRPLDLVCRIGINEWRGVRTPKIYIQDLREASPASLKPAQVCPR